MPASNSKTRDAAALETPTLASLPPADTERWVARRKAQVVAAVQAGLLTLDEAMARYRLTMEEFTSWQRALYRHGLRGLQVTQLQITKLADRRRRGPAARSPAARSPAKPRWRRHHA